MARKALPASVKSSAYFKSLAADLGKVPRNWQSLSPATQNTGKLVAIAGTGLTAGHILYGGESQAARSPVVAELLNEYGITPEDIALAQQLRNGQGAANNIQSTGGQLGQAGATGGNPGAAQARSDPWATPPAEVAESYRGFGQKLTPDLAAYIMQVGRQQQLSPKQMHAALQDAARNGNKFTDKYLNL